MTSSRGSFAILFLVVFSSSLLLDSDYGLVYYCSEVVQGLLLTLFASLLLLLSIRSFIPSRCLSVHPWSFRLSFSPATTSLTPSNANCLSRHAELTSKLSRRHALPSIHRHSFRCEGRSLCSLVAWTIGACLFDQSTFLLSFRFRSILLSFYPG